MDLEDLIKSKNINSWVDKNFKVEAPTVMQKLTDKHPFIFINVNRKLSITANSITCFGIDLFDAYAHRDETNQFALFLLLKSDESTRGKLIDKLGFPSNVTLEWLANGNYDHLSWNLPNDLTIIYQHNRFGNTKAKVQSQGNFEIYTLEVYNMPREVFTQQKGIEDD